MTSREPHSDHARHDALLIAAFAAGDLAGAQRTEAEHLVAACAECARLERDLRAIALATTADSLPVRPRPRSFTLDPAAAARIRPTGWRGIVRRFASPDLSFTRPLAAGLTTLGLAGLLVAALPGMMSLGGSAAAPVPAFAPAGAEEREMSNDAASAAPSASGLPQATPAGRDPAEPPAASPSSGITSHAGPGGSKPTSVPVDGLPGDAGDRLSQAAEENAELLEAAVARDGSSMLAVLAGTSLLVGLGLFGLRWAARRLG